MGSNSVILQEIVWFPYYWGQKYGSLMLRPCPPTTTKGLVTTERFLGCTESTVLILDNPMK